jgi:hypothetical protein
MIYAGPRIFFHVAASCAMPNKPRMCDDLVGQAKPSPTTVSWCYFMLGLGSNKE